MIRSSSVIIYEDENETWHCRFCIGIWELNRGYRICGSTDSYYHGNKSCYSAGGGTRLKDKPFNFDNKKHKIILSTNKNILTKDDISHLQIKCAEKYLPWRTNE